MACNEIYSFMVIPTFFLTGWVIKKFDYYILNYILN